jgi:hypothetical protein
MGGASKVRPVSSTGLVRGERFVEGSRGSQRHEDRSLRREKVLSLFDELSLD